MRGITRWFVETWSEEKDLVRRVADYRVETRKARGEDADRRDSVACALYVLYGGWVMAALIAAILWLILLWRVCYSGGERGGVTQLFSTRSYVRDAMYTPSEQDYIRVSQVFHWAQARHFIEFFQVETSKGGRHKKTEKVLPRLVRKKELIAVRYKHKLVYSSPKRASEQPKIAHGLAVTEALVRLWTARREGEIFAERDFKGLGSVPEFGIRYGNGRMIVVELSTADNGRRVGLLRRKTARYQESLAQIEERFGATCLVLFIMDTPRAKVERFVAETPDTGDPFYFTDWQAFLNVPSGKQLVAPIYIWGEDGQCYRLVEEE
ncbi:MAG: hypothetical protein RB148_09455 [Armatimonadota bacterium]|nr:hypothetical protein [Armatimonadota bacterium]